MVGGGCSVNPEPMNGMVVGRLVDWWVVLASSNKLTL